MSREPLATQRPTVSPICSSLSLGKPVCSFPPFPPSDSSTHTQHSSCVQLCMEDNKNTPQVLTVEIPSDQAKVDDVPQV